MHLSSLVEVIESGFADRALLTVGSVPLTGADVAEQARRGAAQLAGSGAQSIVYVGENDPRLPVLLLASAWAGLPFVPLNYRLDDQRLGELIDRQQGPRVVADRSTVPRLAGRSVVDLETWFGALSPGPVPEPAADEVEVAIVLYTSGTTSEPKAALLRHRNLMAYLLGSVDFGGADESEAMLVSVPPYHVAGIANMLSSLWSGRRLVYLAPFDPRRWLETVRDERITHAMVVPTMLARIVETLDGRPAATPSLRSLAYGGAKVNERVLRAALDAFPTTGFVNAYGLTETASTIAVLGPDDHRAAVASTDPAVRRRLGSVGQVLPTVELEIRDEDGRPLPPGQPGLIHVRGEQVAGEYSTGTQLDADGWFCSRDRGVLDADGYLYIEGRADDTIIRGGENIAPAEIEDVLLRQPGVSEACVVGVPDDEWGERIVAVVVAAGTDADTLREAVRRELRGSKTPDEIHFRAELPYTPTGKLLRRAVAEQLTSVGRST